MTTETRNDSTPDNAVTEDLRERLTALADGELSSEDAAALKTALASDAVLRAEFAAIEKLPRLMRAWPVSVADIDLMQRISTSIPLAVDLVNEPGELSANEQEFLRTAEALKKVMSVPYVDLTKQLPERAALESIPAELARAHGVLPLKRDGNRLWIALSPETLANDSLIDALQTASQCRVEPMFAYPRWLVEKIAEYYPSPAQPPQVAEIQPSAEQSPPAPPKTPIAVAGPPDPDPDDIKQLLLAALAELHLVREDLTTLREEVAALRRERDATAAVRPHTTTSARLFPLAPPEFAQRRH